MRVNDSPPMGHQAHNVKIGNFHRNSAGALVFLNQLPMFPISSRILVVCSLLLGSAYAPSQQLPTFSTTVKVVNVLASVRDKRGQIISTLGKDDFEIQEDGRPQVIRYFAGETDLPLTLGLLSAAS